MIKNRSAPPGTVIPVLIYADVPGAARWLCETFSFAIRVRAGDSHFQLLVGDGSVILGGERSGQDGGGIDHAAIRQPRSNEMSHCIHVRVENVEKHFARVKASGARIVLPLAVHPYGEKQYTVEDPGGHRWTFSESVADVAPEDWGGVAG